MDVRSLIVVAVAALGGAACRSSASGAFQVNGPERWQFAPNTCTLNAARFAGVDMFRRDPDDDSELVVGADELLVRVPGKGIMVRLQRSDCHVFDIDEHAGDVQVNDTAEVVGHVTLDCERPEIGHLVGTATFSCLP